MEPAEGPERPPSFLCCFSIFPAGGRGGALPSVAEAARPRPLLLLLRQPREDSCPNMELGFPRPRPRPQPVGDRALQSRGGSRWLWGWQWGKGYLGVDPDSPQALGPASVSPREGLRLISGQRNKGSLQTAELVQVFLFWAVGK